jgi:hypothetical protein
MTDNLEIFALWARLHQDISVVIVFDKHHLFYVGPKSGDIVSRVAVLLPGQLQTLLLSVKSDLEVQWPDGIVRVISVDTLPNIDKRIVERQAVAVVDPVDISVIDVEVHHFVYRFFL